MIHYATIDWSVNAWWPPIKRWIVRALTLSIVITAWGNATGYLHPLDLCRINIESAFTGTAQTRRAIWQLRGENREAYETLCHEIDIITEDRCYADSRSNVHASEIGCYINGSHIITLTTVSIATDATLRARTAVLKELAYAAEQYWVNTPESSFWDLYLGEKKYWIN